MIEIQKSTQRKKERLSIQKPTIMYREWASLEHSVLNGVSPSNPFPQVSGNIEEEEVERFEAPEGMEDTKETWHSTNKTDTHMNSQILLQHAKVCPSPTRQGPSSERVDRSHPAELRSYSQLTTASKWKISLFKGVSLSNQTPLKGRFHAHHFIVYQDQSQWDL